MSKQGNTIKGIWGHEPMREREYPLRYVVGESADDAAVSNNSGGIVLSITYREDNYGDHGIGWFDVWGPENTLIAAVAARAVAEVQYK